MHELTPGTFVTITQALQMVGLAPSLFLIVFLATLAPRNRQAIIPAFYFLALAFGFALPLAELYPPLHRNDWAVGVLLLGESMLPAFSFLLILQFMVGRVPVLPMWLVLAVPLLGSPIVYVSAMQASDICLPGHVCLDSASVKTLYHVLASSLVFLLLIVYAMRLSGEAGDDATRKHKYWLVIALIGLHLLVLALDLANLAGRVSAGETQFIAAVLRLTFIYLVMTSLFRVYYPAMAQQIVYLTTPPYDPAVEAPHAERIRVLLEDEKIWREMRLNRAALARRAGIGEHHLSRVINRHFGKSFNELINAYRIEEAKRRLRAEPGTQITVIGFEAGFNSIASFNRVFKEKTGLSPTEWRNSASG